MAIVTVTMIEDAPLLAEVGTLVCCHDYADHTCTLSVQIFGGDHDRMRETLGEGQQDHMTGGLDHMTDAPHHHMTDARGHLIVEEGLAHPHTS